MTVYLIGARGRLGRALANEYSDSGVVSLDRSVYEDWSRPFMSDAISRYFDKCSENDTLFVTSGLLDPGLSQEDLMRVNYHLPKNLVDGAAKLGVRVITFGTLMEALSSSKNAYVQSKLALNEYVGTVATINKPVIHFQMHTLYGVGQPDAFMFLGQILTAIRNTRVFKMTSGKQLREYHHLADEAKAIRTIVESNSVGVMDLSHGQPLSLKTIAEGVFQAFGKGSLLDAGALPEPSEENYTKIFKLSVGLNQGMFRDSLSGVVDYMKACYKINSEL